MKQNQEKHVYQLKRVNKPVLIFDNLDSIDDDLKPVFNRMETELNQMGNPFNNPEIKKQFDELENELKRMELVIK